MLNMKAETLIKNLRVILLHKNVQITTMVLGLRIMGRVLLSFYTNWQLILPNLTLCMFLFGLNRCEK